MSETRYAVEYRLADAAKGTPWKIIQIVGDQGMAIAIRDQERWYLGSQYKVRYRKVPRSRKRISSRDSN